MCEPGDQVALPLSGRVRSIDRCIHHIVAALNAANIETLASCCGHGKQAGIITLADGRELVIHSDRTVAIPGYAGQGLLRDVLENSIPVSTEES